MRRETQWKIEVSAEADTKEAAMAMFEVQIAAMRESDYAEQFTAGKTINDECEGYSRSVCAPRPLPLALDEIEKLRALITEKPNAA